MTKPNAPRGLAAGGKRLWQTVLAHTVELDPGQVRLLEDACREADLIDEMESEQRNAPKVTKGSMGQQVAAPLVQELRQHRATLSGLLRQLDLSKAQSTAAIQAAVEARLAQERDKADAQARWRERSAK